MDPKQGCLERTEETKTYVELVAAGGKFYQQNGQSWCDLPTSSWVLANLGFYRIFDDTMDPNQGTDYDCQNEDQKEPLARPAQEVAGGKGADSGAGGEVVGIARKDLDFLGERPGQARAVYT